MVAEKKNIGMKTVLALGVILYVVIFGLSIYRLSQHSPECSTIAPSCEEGRKPFCWAKNEWICEKAKKLYGSNLGNTPQTMINKKIPRTISTTSNCNFQNKNKKLEDQKCFNQMCTGKMYDSACEAYCWVDNTCVRTPPAGFSDSIRCNPLDKVDCREKSDIICDAFTKTEECYAFCVPEDAERADELAGKCVSNVVYKT